MPTVGKKHFAYTEKGKKAAEAESKRTGKKVKKKWKKKDAILCVANTARKPQAQPQQRSPPPPPTPPPPPWTGRCR